MTLLILAIYLPLLALATVIGAALTTSITRYEKDR